MLFFYYPSSYKRLRLKCNSERKLFGDSGVSPALQNNNPLCPTHHHSASSFGYKPDSSASVFHVTHSLPNPLTLAAAEAADENGNDDDSSQY